MRGHDVWMGMLGLTLAAGLAAVSMLIVALAAHALSNNAC
mgnify:CR=1 FL=1